MKTNSVVFILLSILLLAGIFEYFRDNSDKELEKNHLYTIGRIKRIQMPDNGSEIVNYHYSVKGKEYSNFFSVLPENEGQFRVGLRVLTMFLPTNPKRSRVLYESSVPDTLRSPFNGWKELPDNICR